MNEIKKIIKILKCNKLTLSICESVTGGKLSSYLTSFNGSSVYFLGSIISYNNNSKVNVVKIDKNILKLYGAVSEQTAKCMAINTKNIFNSDIAISITGNAGKNVIENKKRGLAFVCLVFHDQFFSFSIVSNKITRKNIIKSIIKLTIINILEIIKKEKLF